MPHDNLRARTFQYSVACIKAARPLLADPLGRLLVGQVVRSGGGVGANYSSACHAKSRPDFASKISTVAEEAAEAAFWFQLFVAVDLLAETTAGPPMTEGRELASIATASARTARRRRRPDDL
jgi:four helix bundle protein